MTDDAAGKPGTHGKEPATEHPDWENEYPADPDLMTDLEGDSRGLNKAKGRALDRMAKIRDRS